MKRILAATLVPLLLSGCVDRIDYHGIDPKAYNETLYPKVNKVRQNAVYHSFYFADGASVFDAAMLRDLDAFLSRTYPSAAQSLQLNFAHASSERETYVTRLLRARGFKKSSMDTVVDSTLHPDEVVIHMHYSYVESPPCPDWRKSSNINYSNTNYSNLGCTSVTNLGLQVANPNDLIGTANQHIAPDGHMGANAISQYRAGEGEVEAATQAAASESE